MWPAVVVGLGFLTGEAVVLNARVRDYDEGVYWQSVRAMARNEPLFRSVFASQPPIFYEALLPFYWAGYSLTVPGLVAVALAATSPL